MLRLLLPLPGRDADSAPSECPKPATAWVLNPPIPTPPAGPATLGDGAPDATDDDVGGGPPEGSAVARNRGTEADGFCWVGDTEDSFESEPLRSEAISTMTVSRRALPRGPTCSWALDLRALDATRRLPNEDAGGDLGDHRPEPLSIQIEADGATSPSALAVSQAPFVKMLLARAAAVRVSTREREKLACQRARRAAFPVCKA